MLKLSHILFLGAALVVTTGCLVLAGVVTVALPGPPTMTPISLTFSLRDLLTPTPAFLGTPLAPPHRQTGPTILLLPAPEVANLPVTASLPPHLTNTPVMQTAHTAAPVIVAPEFSPTLSPTARTPSATPMLTATPPLIPDQIVIPALGVDAPVLPVGWELVMIEDQAFGQWAVPDGLAAGWHNTSAPLGVPGNTVLNGHHNMAGAIFGGLIDLEPGAVIILKSGGQAFHYSVAQLITVQERWQTIDERLDNARWIQPSADERITLVTCWPPNDNSFRLIVVAVPVADVRQ